MVYIGIDSDKPITMLRIFFIKKKCRVDEDNKIIKALYYGLNEKTIQIPLLCTRIQILSFIVCDKMILISTLDLLFVPTLHCFFG
jgi:hypothetical protein